MKEIERLKKELKEAKLKIKRLEKSLEENMPTFHGWFSKTGSNNGEVKFVKWEKEY